MAYVVEINDWGAKVDHITYWDDRVRVYPVTLVTSAQLVENPSEGSWTLAFDVHRGTHTLHATVAPSLLDETQQFVRAVASGHRRLPVAELIRQLKGTSGQNHRSEKKPVWVWERRGRLNLSLRHSEGAACVEVALLPLIYLLLTDPIMAEPAIQKLAEQRDLVRAVTLLMTWKERRAAWDDAFEDGRPQRNAESASEPESWYEERERIERTADSHLTRQGLTYGGKAVSGGLPGLGKRR